MMFTLLYLEKLKLLIVRERKSMLLGLYSLLTCVEKWVHFAADLKAYVLNQDSFTTPEAKDPVH